MHHSILQFIEKDIREIEKSMGKLLTGEKDADDLSAEILERTTKLANRLVCELYEKLDEEIRNSISRKVKWNIEKRNEPKELLDVAGVLRFSRTGYEDKRTGEYIYLLDRILGLEGHQRITVGAAAKILEEAVTSSYAKGGKAASRTEEASKQAVKRLVHDTVVEFPIAEKMEKKKRRHLHIVADEDHVAAQYWKQKGDLSKDEGGRKNNTLMPKVVCVYEDIINESGEQSKSARYRLTGKHYFCGNYKGKENIELWEEVQKYIEKTYDQKVLERVYIAGDGASWIKAGVEVVEKSRFVLDKFHMMKYVNRSVVHLGDNAEEVKEEIWEYLNGAQREELKGVYRRILAETKPGSKYEEVMEAERYLLNQWNGIKIRKEEAGGCWSCCAEGQVSHVLSARMSSRPMGWSEHGCDQMAKLRAYHWNGGKIINLLKYQKDKRKKEERREAQEELIKELRNKQENWKYAEQIQRKVPGLEKQSMKWLKSLIYQAIEA